jgi:hypothetical protein
MSLVLLRIKEHVVVRAFRKLALRRSAAEPFLRLVTNVARGLRLRRELRHVTLDAGLVTRECQPESSIVRWIVDQRLHLRRSRMT